MTMEFIDGKQFAKMAHCGFLNLKNNESLLNKINFFPVPDGDTGTNMRSTFESALKAMEDASQLNVCLESMSKAMLFGARGNSGAILSQLFKGFCFVLKNKPEANVSDLKSAFRGAFEFAYDSVVTPSEGTILTVAREGILNAASVDTSDVVEFFENYSNSLKQSLETTKNAFLHLKTRDIVDSGGFGYCLIIEGMLKCLRGEKIEEKDACPEFCRSAARVEKSFDENSDFIDGYCLEFLLQLLRSKCDVEKVSRADIAKELSPFGDSLVVVIEGHVVKIHIHTKNPAAIIEKSLKYGEFVSFKLENMQLQHNEHIVAAKENAVKIAAVSDFSWEKILPDCDFSFKIGDDAAEKIREILSFADASHYVIFPNDERVFNQIKSKNFEKSVSVIPTKNIVECYFSLTMDDEENENFDFRVRQMMQAAKDIQTAKIEFRTESLSGALEKTISTLSSLGIAEKNAALMFASADVLKFVAEPLQDAFQDIQFSFFEIESVGNLFIGLV